MFHRLISRLVHVAGISLLSLLLFGAPAASAQAAGAAKDEGWQPVDGTPTMMQPRGESIPAATLVGVAYGFIWVMVAGFVLTVWVRQSRVDREITELRARIAEAEKRGARG